MRTSAPPTIGYGHAGVSGAGPGRLRRFLRRASIWATSSAICSARCSTWAAAPQPRGSRQQRGDDLRFDLAIDFEDAIFGAETRDQDPPPGNLPHLQWPRQRLGTRSHGVRQCQGRGQIRYQQGFFSVARTCGACGGTGSIIGDPCQTCRGETRVAKELKLNVKVPPGVEDGTRIRYAGEGDAGRSGGAKGDLYVVLSIRPHDFFERDGQDLHCVVPISFPQAALGAEIEIPGIDGPVNLKIPEGTQSGKELRMRGRGVPFLNEKGHGDLVVKVLVQVPRKLTRAQRERGPEAGRADERGQQAHVAIADGEDEGPVQLIKSCHPNQLPCPVPALPGWDASLEQVSDGT